jgi:hypothetical protein
LEEEADVNTHAPDADALNEIRLVIGRAKKGDTAALPRLRELLDTHPILWQRYGDLASQAERLWVDLAAGPDQYLRECLLRQAEAMRQELAGADAGPVERLLVERVVLTWLQLHYFDAITAQAAAKDEPPKLALYRGKRQAQAHRAYLSAVAALTTLRRLLPRHLQASSPAPAPGDSGDKGGDSAKRNGHRPEGAGTGSPTPAAALDKRNRIADLLARLGDGDGLVSRPGELCGAGRDMTRKEPNVTPLTECTRGELVLDLLLGALRVGDEHLNALATELLRRCGEAPVRRLVQEAADRKNRPAYRLRVLEAIRCIGRVTDLIAYLDLSVMSRDKNTDIRSAVAELLQDFSHRQTSPLAEEERELAPATPSLAGRQDTAFAGIP